MSNRRSRRASRRGDIISHDFLVNLPRERWPELARVEPGILRILGSRRWIVIEGNMPECDGLVRTLTIRPAGGPAHQRMRRLTATDLRDIRCQAGLGEWTLVDIVPADIEEVPGAPAHEERVVYLVRPGSLPFYVSRPARGTEGSIG